MAKDWTKSTDLAPEVDFLRSLMRSAFVDKLVMVLGQMAPPGVMPAFLAMPAAKAELTQGNFIQRPNFRAGGSWTRQNRDSVSTVDAASKDQGYALDVILSAKKGPEAWSKRNSKKNLPDWSADFVEDAGQGAISYMQEAFCTLAAAAAQKDANHFLDLSGDELGIDDIMELKASAWEDASEDRAVTLMITSRQRLRLEKFIVLGPADGIVTNPLGNPQAQEYNRSGRVETLAGMRVVTYNGLFQDADGNDFALILAKDTRGNPGSGLLYQGESTPDNFSQKPGTTVDFDFSLIGNNDSESLIYTALAEMIFAPFVDKIRFDSTIPNPTFAQLADTGNLTTDCVDHRELTVAAICDGGDAH